VRKLSKKQKIAAAGAAVVVAAGAGTAYAYWSSTGTGTGSAATSAGGADLTVTQTSTISNMYPGDSPQTIAGTVTNNAANSAYVANVVVSIKGVAQAAGATGTCGADDYSLVNPTMAIGQDIASGGTVKFSGATIQFNNKGTNQDGCKGATVNLGYAAS
jgi:hypothetical protein